MVGKGQTSHSMLLAAVCMMAVNALETSPLLRRDTQDASGSSSLVELKSLGDYNSVLEDAGINPSEFSLQKFDTNGDGHLSKNELQAAMPAIKQKGVIEKLARQLETEKQKDEEDRRVFQAADLDGSSFLEQNEVENFLDHTIVDRNAFDWHEYDRDHDNRLSVPEFLKAGRAVVPDNLLRPAGDEASLSETGAASDNVEEEAEMNRRHVDSQIFKNADTNGDGYLEPAEIKTLLSHAGIEAFPWHEHDLDGDGQLSENEFVAAGPASAQMHKKKQDEKIDREIFRQLDTDKSSFLEAGEINAFLQKANLKTQYFNWRDHDEDQDDRLSEDEFMKAGKPAEHAAVLQREHDALLQQDSKLLNEADDDIDEMGSHQPGSLADSPDGPSIDASDVPAGDPDSPEGENDDDDAEFAPPKHKTYDGPKEYSSPPSSLASAKSDSRHISVDADGNNGDDPPPLDTEPMTFDSKTGKTHKSSFQLEEDDEVVFDMMDRNHDGFLEGHEIGKLMRTSGERGFRWKNYDTNSDGKLSKKEFFNAAQIMKDKSSPEFKKKVLQLIGEHHREGSTQLSILQRHAHHKDPGAPEELNEQVRMDSRAMGDTLSDQGEQSQTYSDNSEAVREGGVGDQEGNPPKVYAGAVAESSDASVSE